MTTLLTKALGLGAVCALAACGGGSTNSSGGTTTPTPTSGSFTYQTLNSTADATSDLVGNAVRTNGSTAALDVTTSSGTLKHDTGATTISDGTVTLTDPDGASNSVLMDSSGATSTQGTLGFTGNYDSVTDYRLTYTANGTNFDSIGVGGVATRPQDMPSSGNATYTGEAVGTLVTGSQGFDLAGGTSTVSASFGTGTTGTVNVTMNGFTVRDQASGTTNNAPLDVITVNGMTIADNGFSGGTAGVSLNGASVNVTGTNTSHSAQGHFFGFDTGTSQPDEVGGSVLITGDSGRIVTTFIGD